MGKILEELDDLQWSHHFKNFRRGKLNLPRLLQILILKLQTYAIVRCKIFYCTDAGDQNLKAEVKFEPENASVVLSFPSALQVTVPVQVPILSNICR